MGKQANQIVAGAVLVIVGVLMLANPGFMDLRETLLDKPLAVALPTAVLVVAGVLLGVTRQRSVLAILATVVLAVLLGAALWLFAPPAFEFADGGMRTLPEALMVGLVVGAVSGASVAIGLGSRALFRRSRSPIGSTRA